MLWNLSQNPGGPDQLFDDKQQAMRISPHLGKTLLHPPPDQDDDFNTTKTYRTPSRSQHKNPMFLWDLIQLTHKFVHKLQPDKPRKVGPDLSFEDNLLEIWVIFQRCHRPLVQRLEKGGEGTPRPVTVPLLD